MSHKFEVFRDTAGYYRWRFKSSNNEIVAQSEGYTSKASAVHGINVLKQQAANAAVVDLT